MSQDSCDSSLSLVVKQDPGDDKPEAYDLISEFNSLSNLLATACDTFHHRFDAIFVAMEQEKIKTQEQLEKSRKSVLRIEAEFESFQQEWTRFNE
jgi:hypothetical protein